VSSGIPDSTDLLASLDPGPYEFRVVAVDRKASLTVTRTTDFTVE
jgi:hypothetical protein